MDPPYTIEAFLEQQSKIAVRVTNDDYFERFVKELLKNPDVPQNFSPGQFERETVIIHAKMSNQTFFLQPTLSFAEDLGYVVVEASEFFEPNNTSYSKIEGLLEELLCP